MPASLFVPGTSSPLRTSSFRRTRIADPTKFPERGRTKIRKNFPTDYIFAAMSAPESLAQTIQRQLEHYDSVDR